MDKRAAGPSALRSSISRRIVERAHWPRTRRERLQIMAWAVVLYGLAAPILRLTVGYDSIGFVITLAAAVAALLWVAPQAHEIRTWLFYIVSIYFFVQLRDAADETAIEASTGYVLDWELWMFGGTTPSAWLQEQLGGAAGDPGPLAYVTVFMHWFWFLFPHAVVAATFYFIRPMFFRVAAIMAGIFFFAVGLYYLVPTVPPWLAAEEGATSGIVRIMEDVGPTLFGQTFWDQIFEFLAGPNPRAAMPSLHFAVAFGVAIVALLIRAPRLLVVAVVYSIWLAFSLVYLGEHYFADLIAGVATALAAIFLVETALGNGPGGRAVGRLRRRASPRADPSPRTPRAARHPTGPTAPSDLEAGV